VAVLLIWGIVVAVSQVGRSECDRYNNRLATEITILQRADPSLSFSEASLRAEIVLGSAPKGC